MNQSARTFLFFIALLLTGCSGVSSLQLVSRGRVINISVAVQISTPTPAFSSTPTITPFPTPTQDIYTPASQTPMYLPTMANTPVFATNTPTPLAQKTVSSSTGVNVRAECGQFYRKVGTLFYADKVTIKQIVYNDRREKWYWVSGINRAGDTIEGCSVAIAF